MGNKTVLRKCAIPMNINENREIEESGSSVVDSKADEFIEMELSSPPRKKIFTSNVNSSSAESSSSSKRRREDIKMDHLYYRSPSKKYVSPTKSTSSGTSSTTSSQRLKRVKLDHSYYHSPTKLSTETNILKKKYKSQSKKLYKQTEKVKTLKSKVDSLKQIIDNLKSKNALSTDAFDYLEKTFGDMPASLMQRMLKASRTGSLTREKYPPVLRNFALTLNFYSSRAYDYVRRKFNLALPHPSVLRKWSATVECEPGFSTVCFEALKKKVYEANETNKTIHCSLLFDEMDIKKQIDFDGKRYWGYVDLGTDLNTDDVPHAVQALVLMVVCVNASWKIPIAYFLIKSLNSSEKANIIKEALIRLESININVISVTCDGPSTNFAMFKDLECDFRNVHSMTPYFPHPSNMQKKVYATFDACHMLKLVRRSKK